MTDGRSGVHTFLIADIRGYSRFTENYGDEAAAELSRAFADVVRDIVETHEGELREMRGDEALAVFASARQAIRAAVELQEQLDDPTSSIDIPCKVGIGVDSGEAVQLEDGSFRGAALNIAARLCGRAHGGEVLVSEATVRLAGRLGGVHYSDRGRLRLKNIPDPIHVFKVYSELQERPAGRSVLMFFGRPGGRTLTWGAAALVVLIAAITAAAVVYLTAGDGAEGGEGPRVAVARGGTQAEGLQSVVPTALWQNCELLPLADPGADDTAVCVPESGLPDRWQISTYPSGVALDRAYEAQLETRKGLQPNKGRCNAESWGGEGEWLHGPRRPGGRYFCYFEGDDAVIVWTHGRLNQPSHLDILATAREEGADHAGLTDWWRPWHHRIGKAN